MFIEFVLLSCKMVQNYVHILYIILNFRGGGINPQPSCVRLCTLCYVSTFCFTLYPTRAFIDLLGHCKIYRNMLKYENHYSNFIKKRIRFKTTNAQICDEINPKTISCPKRSYRFVLCKQLLCRKRSNCFITRLFQLTKMYT